MPTSLDFAITSRKRSWSKTSWSLMRIPAISTNPWPQSITSSGSTTLSCRAAAAVKILKMLPGSKESDTARLRQRALG